MNRTVKLLSVAVVVLVVLASIEAYVIETAPLSANSVEPIRVACVGDSLTRGTEYTLFLWERLGSGYILSDFGVGGTTVALSSDKPYMNESAFRLAQSFQPNIVIIMLGTNDAGINQTKEGFIQDYTTLIGAFQALSTKPTIFIVKPPPIVNSTALSNNRLAGTINVAISSIAVQTHVTPIDAYTPMLNYPGDYTDGVHPNADGAKVIADTIYSSLRDAGYS